MKFAPFFLSYCISCLVQLLCIRFHKMLHFTFDFVIFVLSTPFNPSLFTPPPPPPSRSLTSLPVYHNRHSPPFMGGYLLVEFGGGGL